MTVDLKDRKYGLIEIIMGIDDEATLQKIEDELKSIHTAGNEDRVPNIEDAIRPIRSGVTLEQMEAEQNYQPITYAAFRELASELELTESTEELLSMLTK